MPIQTPSLRRAGLQAVTAGLLALPVLAPAALTAAFLTAPAAAAAPEPNPVPRRWQLDVEVGPLRMATVETPEHGRRDYLYMAYEVVNNSGEDLLFAPMFELATDEGDLLRSGRGVPAAVTQELLRRLENPFLEDQISIIDVLLQGEENAKEGLVVWPAEGLKVDELSIYAAGFSGETVTLELPVAPPAPEAPAIAGLAPTPAPTAPEAAATTPPRIHGAPPMDDPAADGEEKTRKVVLRKTLMLRYRIPGELGGRGSEEFPVSERRWIMR